MRSDCTNFGFKTLCGWGGSLMVEHQLVELFGAGSSPVLLEKKNINYLFNFFYIYI